MKFYVFTKAMPKVWLPPKLLMVMKLTTLLLVLALVQVSAKSFSQRITLDENNAPLKKVLKAIESQSGYVFFYDSKAINKKVDIHVNNAAIEDVLAECFKNIAVSYKIVDKNIFLRQKSVPSPTAEIAIALITVKGKVTDTKGEPLIGATVRAKKANKAVVADVNGIFELKDIPADDILLFSYTGFVSKEVPANDPGLSNVVLQEDIKAMSEVVVVGYGTQKKVNLTGAVSQISSEDLGYHPTPNIANSLQGLLPGLNIQANTGNPGDKPDINIRGFNSVNGGTPLILIDGIQGDIDRVNPLDVETVTVLKDAASAAIYGARGSFGVILITTKKGKAGKTVVNYTNNFGRTTPVIRTDYISDPYEYGKIVDAFLSGYNGTVYTNYTNADYAKERQVADGTLAPFNEKQADGTYKFFGKTNWYDLIFRKWQPSQTHNLSISGGNDKLQAYLSGRAYNVGTIQANVDAKLIKYNIKGNINFNVNKWLSLSDNIQVSTADQTEYGGSKAGYVSTGVYNQNTYYYLFPFMPSSINGVPYDYNGYGEVAALGDKNSFQKTYSEQLVNTISARLTPVKDLVFNVDYSNTINHIAVTTRENPITYLTTTKANLQTVGINSLTEARNRNYYNALNVYGTYNKSLFNDQHHFKLLLGYNQEDFSSDNITAQQGDLLVSNLSNLSLGTNLLQATGSGSLWAIRGYFGRFNYDYKNKYLLEVNGRYDGSSRFPLTSRYGFFPSISGGWYISRENFFKPLEKVISSLKLRTSYGQLGNQNIDLYTFSQILSTGQTYWVTNSSRMNYVGAPSPLPSVVTWENSKTIDFGADLGLFNDKFNVSFDWYEKNVSGMYVPGQPLPAVFGAPEPKENIASLRDRGFELQLSYNSNFNLAGAPLRLKSTFSLYNFVGVITKYPNPSGLMSSFYEGQTLGDIYGYHIDGQFQSDAEAAAYQAKFVNPATSLGQVYNYELNIVQNAQWKGLHAGDIKYVDVNGDGAINKGNNTVANHGDLVKIGNVMPKFPFGFNFSADWKNFDLMVAGTGVMHQDWYPTGDIYWGPYERPYLSFIRKDLIPNAWTPENPGNKYPQAVRGYASLGTLRSLGEINDYYLTNVGYLRVKNLTLGYTFPVKLTQKVGIDRLRIYFTGENLFTWSFGGLTKYIDPETAGSGIDYSTPQNVYTSSSSGSIARAGESYPLGKVYSIGLSITL